MKDCRRLRRFLPPRCFRFLGCAEPAPSCDNAGAGWRSAEASRAKAAGLGFEVGGAGGFLVEGGLLKDMASDCEQREAQCLQDVRTGTKSHPRWLAKKGYKNI